jgi:hypothetical protein
LLRNLDTNELSSSFSEFRKRENKHRLPVELSSCTGTLNSTPQLPARERRRRAVAQEARDGFSLLDILRSVPDSLLIEECCSIRASGHAFAQRTGCEFRARGLNSSNR